VISEEQWMK